MVRQEPIASLLGLRGVMALHVAIRHLRLADGGILAMALSPIRFGLIGHQLFFVLSGFGLTYSMLRREESGRSPSLGRYYADRWRRLAPPYYAAMLLVLLSSLPKALFGYRYGPPIRLVDVIAHLTFVHGFWESTNGRMYLSSISPIFQFYLIFPLLHALMRKLDYRFAFCIVILFWLAFRAWIQAATLGEPVFLAGMILDRLFPFTSGMAVAHWFAARRPGAGGCARTASAWAAGFLGLAVVAQNWGPHRWMDVPYGLGFGALLVATLISVQSRGRLCRALSHPRLLWLGTISYSLYLTHFFSYVVTGHLIDKQLGVRVGLLSDAVSLTAGLTMAIAIAWGFNRLVERPIRPARSAG